VGPVTGLLALAVLDKGQQQSESVHDHSSVINRHPQLLKPQYNYEPTQGPCGALNLSMKTTPTETLVALLWSFVDYLASATFAP